LEVLVSRRRAEQAARSPAEAAAVTEAAIRRCRRAMRAEARRRIERSLPGIIGRKAS
jgi:uncharacterized protein (DUF2267 family)